MTDVKEVVREKYSQAARRVRAAESDCCGPSPTCCDQTSPITSNLYDSAETAAVPESAILASLGCGNPTPGPPAELRLPGSDMAQALRSWRVSVMWPCPALHKRGQSGLSVRIVGNWARPGDRGGFRVPWARSGYSRL
jgi:hypothetical protein